MRKLFLIVITLFFIVSSKSNGQTSIGFSDPDDISSILDYRLPDWGYTNIYLDFSLNGSVSNIDENLTTEPGKNFLINFGPNINRYRESEKRVFSIIAQPVFEYGSRDESQTSSDLKIKSTNLTLPWSVRHKRFLDQSDLFLNVSNAGHFVNVRSANNEYSGMTTINDIKNTNRFFFSELSIGLGYGRIRNVNPMIRSLRLAERYKALDNANDTFENNDILSASELFSKRDAYNQLYDRPMRFFWNDLNSAISPDLSSLDPFDFLYLTDTEFENIGSRIEGWEVDLSIGMIYNIVYLRFENLLNSMEFSDHNRFLDFAPRFSFRWYRNYSLKNQIGFQGSYNYRTSIYKSSSNLFSPNHVINSAFNWVYNLTDRILTNTAITYLYIGRELSQSHLLSHSVAVQTEINYFIENKVSLFLNSGLNFVQFDSSDMSPENGRRFRFNAGIRYFMKRDLY